MKVVTLSEKALKAETRRLAAEVHKNGFSPDLVVGIRTGGEHIALIVMQEFPAARLLVVRRQRAGTKVKKKLKISLVLRRLPYGITNRLRILEHRMLERKFSQSDRSAKATQKLEPAVECVLPLEKDLMVRRILVVDDAIDSGETMAAVVGYLAKEFPHAEIRTFVISSTMKSPVLTPDYALNGYGLLVRFHWSEDYHATN